MKHGPIALLDESTPVVCVATDSPVLDKVLSNVEEVRARGAADDRDRDRRLRAGRRGRRRDDRGRAHGLDPAADPRDPAAAAARLRHRPGLRPQRRPAPQSGQDRHRRVAAAAVAARLRPMIKTRLVLPVLAAAAALALLAGCGGGGDSSSTDPASVAPPETPVFIEATMQPTGYAEDERRRDREEGRRGRRPRRDDRLLHSKAPPPPTNRSTSKRTCSRGWAKRPGSS